MTQFDCRGDLITGIAGAPPTLSTKREKAFNTKQLTSPRRGAGGTPAIPVMSRLYNQMHLYRHIHAGLTLCTFVTIFIRSIVD